MRDTATPGRTRTLAAAASMAAAVAVASGAAAQERPDLGGLEEAVEAVERLDAMRSRLAETFSRGDVEADRETFRKVCRPVGKEARGIASRNGWAVQQLSEKYRNPAHEPDPEAVGVLRRMAADDDLAAVVRRTSLDGVEGTRYFRRITVEPACLACHGARDERPEFVREGYPQDRAYGFEPGDLRGAYAVFVPDSLREGRGGAGSP
jgi:hypothetical protein